MALVHLDAPRRVRWAVARPRLQAVALELPDRSPQTAHAGSRRIGTLSISEVRVRDGRVVFIMDDYAWWLYSPVLVYCPPGTPLHGFTNSTTTIDDRWLIESWNRF